MLKGWISLVVAVLVVAIVLPPQVSAKPTPAPVPGDCSLAGRTVGAKCKVGARIPGKSAKPKGSNKGSGGNSEKKGPFGVDLDKCVRVQPQPPKSHYAWGGRTTGGIYRCAEFGSMQWMWIWLPDASARQVDPEALARQLFAEIDLKPIDLGLFPYGDDPPMVVRLPVWMWADEPSREQWGPVSASVSEGGVVVSLTAQVRHVVWDMGNGDRVVCGKGSVFPEMWSVTVEGPWSATCGYVYRRDGCYTVRASSVWDVYWSGGGRSGVIPLRLEASKRVKVVEVRTYVAVSGYGRTRKPMPITCEK